MKKQNQCDSFPKISLVTKSKARLKHMLVSLGWFQHILHCAEMLKCSVPVIPHV